MAHGKTVSVDISPTHISIGLLTSGRVLRKSIVEAVPQGLIVDGVIKNPHLLAKTIKEMCIRGKIGRRAIVLSCVTKPLITKIVELPRDTSIDPAQFIRDELKHCTMFSGKTIVQDFCSIPPLTRGAGNRVLLVAADDERIAATVTALNRLGLNVEAVEPRLIAAMRSIYGHAIEKKFTATVIVVFADDLDVTFCVFRKTRLDLIRSSAIDPLTINTASGAACIADEINSIRQFYDLETEECQSSWDIFVIGNPAASQCEILKEQLAGIGGMNISICTPDQIEKHTRCAGTSGSHISYSALGLALGRLTSDCGDIKTNLLSACTDEVHNFHRYAIKSVNVAAMAFLAVLVAVPFVKMRITALKSALASQQSDKSHELQSLLRAQNDLNKVRQSYTDRLACIDKLARSNHQYNWPAILDDLARRTPMRVSVSGFIAGNDLTVIITGQAVSHEDVNAFVKLLASAPAFESAQLVRSESNVISSSLISYTISCKLSEPKGSDPNAH